MLEINSQIQGRRAFVKNGMLILTSCLVTFDKLLAADKPVETLKVGLITDMHYADKPAKGSRYYQETPAKLKEAAEYFEQHKLNFLVELGDMIDSAESLEKEAGYLKVINKEFSSISKQRHYVLGNHCVESLTKEEFLKEVEQEKSYYSFDEGNFHFLILDACFTSEEKPYGRKNFSWDDANIPVAELDWLKKDLTSNSKPTIVFIHQRLDVETKHGVKNNSVVRKVLEDSGRVLAVFQGHSHQNDLITINNIHYCTLVAMIEGSGVENNGYSLLEIFPDGTLMLHGNKKQKSYDWKKS